MMQRLKFITAFLAAPSARLRNFGTVALLSMLSFNLNADYQRLEAIVAVVDDDVVLASELIARLETVRRSMRENNVQLPPGDVLVNQIMERLIIENIQLQEAEKLYRAILQSQPQHPDANHNLGVLAVGVGKVEGAIPHFKAALAANAKMEQYWLSYIDALIKLNQMDTAKAVLEQARGSGLQGEKFDNLQVQLTDGAGSSLRVELDGLIALYQQGRYQRMLARASQLEKQYPDDPNIPNLLGVVNAALQNHEEAITHYNKAIKLKPDYAEAYNNLGIILKNIGKYDLAVVMYTRVLKLNPLSANAYNNVGDVFNAVSYTHLTLPTKA